MVASDRSFSFIYLWFSFVTLKNFKLVEKAHNFYYGQKPEQIVKTQTSSQYSRQQGTEPQSILAISRSGEALQLIALFVISSPGAPVLVDVKDHTFVHV